MDVIEAMAREAAGRWMAERMALAMAGEGGSGERSLIEAFQSAIDAAEKRGRAKVEPILRQLGENAAQAAKDYAADKAALEAEVARLREALVGMVEIQDMMEAEGCCDHEYIDPRVDIARAALREGEG
jgi:hypothetical protein